MKLSHLFVLLLSTSAFAASFTGALERNPEQIWSTHLDPKTKDSVAAYQNHKTLPSGVAYGSIIRTLNLSAMCEDQITAWAKDHSCTRKDDVIREPKNNTPVLDASGKRIPLVSYVCPDGGAVRTKPNGDPTSTKNTKPDAVKAMRFFGVDKYDNFGDEAFKVDNAGQAVPKWPKDMNADLNVEEWAHDAHTPLVKCK